MERELRFGEIFPESVPFTFSYAISHTLPRSFAHSLAIRVSSFVHSLSRAKLP